MCYLRASVLFISFRFFTFFSFLFFFFCFVSFLTILFSFFAFRFFSFLFVTFLLVFFSFFFLSVSFRFFSFFFRFSVYRYPAGSRVSIHVTRCTLYPNKYQKQCHSIHPPGRQNIRTFDRVSWFLRIDATFHLKVTKLIVLQQLWLSQAN